MHRVSVAEGVRIIRTVSVHVLLHAGGHTTQPLLEPSVVLQLADPAQLQFPVPPPVVVVVVQRCRASLVRSRPPYIGGLPR